MPSILMDALRSLSSLTTADLKPSVLRGSTRFKATKKGGTCRDSVLACNSPRLTHQNTKTREIGGKEKLAVDQDRGQRVRLFAQGFYYADVKLLQVDVEEGMPPLRVAEYFTQRAQGHGSPCLDVGVARRRRCFEQPVAEDVEDGIAVGSPLCVGQIGRIVGRLILITVIVQN